MRILVDQSGYELLNMGDVAMLQSCVLRLLQQWPEAKLMIIAGASADMPTHCPGVMPVRRTSGQLFNRVVPQGYRPILQSIAPYFSGHLSHGRVLQVEPRNAVQAVRAADAVVAAGGGYVTDTWRWHATGVLSVLSLAQRLGKPTAMFGQGVGPVGQRLLRMQARAVLPGLAVLGLREANLSLGLALALGAKQAAVSITGDDALELVDSNCSPAGDSLGVNVRLTGYAGVDPAAAAAIGEVVLRAATALQVPIVALPVSRRGADADLAAIRGMLQLGSSATNAVLCDLPTPKDLITATARCRAIVTGSYHAAVFSLAQGVPAVCVTNSSYYDGKFAGLRALFPDICFITALSAPDAVGGLRANIQRAWHASDQSRAASIATAALLRDAGRAAYRQFHDAVEKNAAATAVGSEEFVR